MTLLSFYTIYNKDISTYLVLLYDSFVFFVTLEKIKSGLKINRVVHFVPMST